MKRCFDFCVALLVLLAFLPVFFFVSILVYYKLGSPIIFIQERPGLREKIFKMMKFRTMLNSFDKDGVVLPDEKRMTTFGSFLRSSSLDELPGLINVLKGDMSLVGPRPLLVEYLPLYTKDQARRHDVRPGITGWAQVNGRNAISWEEKFALDVWYVDNRSIWFDVKIVFMTIKKVVCRDGISAVGEVTMSKFTGKKP